MRKILVGAVGVSALTLSAAASTVAFAGASLNFDGMAVAASNGPPLKPLVALDCPASQGELTRIAQAADGKSCDYPGGRR